MGEKLFALVITALVLAGLVVIYLRRSPFQGLRDERAAHLAAQEGKSTVEAAEGAALLVRHRALIRDLVEILRHERATTEMLRGDVTKERDASQAFCDQINAWRLAVEGLCAQLITERLASHALCEQLDVEREFSAALCEELDVERVALLDGFDHLNAPERAEAAAQALEKGPSLRIDRSQWKRSPGANPAARRRDEETRREGIPAPLAMLADQRAARVSQESAHGEKPAALEAESGGATSLSQVAPRALSATPAMKAAGLGREKREHVASPLAPPRRTITEIGMHAVHPQVPARSLLQRIPAPQAAKTLLSVPAPGAAPTSSPSDSEAPPPDHAGARDTLESLPLFSTDPRSVEHEVGK